jgi:hypothetical protein
MDRKRARQKPRNEVGESYTGVRMATHESTKAHIDMAQPDDLDLALTELVQAFGNLSFVINIIRDLHRVSDRLLSLLPDELRSLQATIGRVIEAAKRHNAEPFILPAGAIPGAGRDQVEIAQPLPAGDGDAGAVQAPQLAVEP